MPMLLEERPEVLKDAPQEQEQNLNEQKDNQQKDKQQKYKQKHVTPGEVSQNVEQEPPRSEMKSDQQTTPLFRKRITFA